MSNDDLTVTIEPIKQASPTEIKKAKELCQAALLQLAMYHKFFASLALQIPVEVCQQTPNGSPIPTAATCGSRIYFNPLFALELSRPEVVGVMVHEVMHVALRHPWRVWDGIDNDLANEAMDYEINLALSKQYASLETRRISLPESALLDHAFEGMSWEQIYRVLEKRPRRPNPKPRAGVVLRAGSAGSVIDKDGAVVKDKTEADVTAMVTRAASAALMTKSLDARVLGIFTEGLKPKVPWNELLRHYMTAKAGQEDYTMRRPDRRFTAGGFYLPTLVPDDSFGTLVVAIDVSGSIESDAKLLATFFDEIEASIEQLRPAEVVLIQCDHMVRSVEHFERGHGVSGVIIRGGGGTDFAPVFDHITEMGEEPIALVFLTDGEGYFPAKPPSYDVIWVDYGGTSRYPFGQVVRAH